jgi:hypothetical protein
VAQDLDGDTAVQLFVVRGIHHAQSALAKLAFDTETRQARWLIGVFGGWLAIAAAPLTYAQSGLDALARLLPHSFG